MDANKNPLQYIIGNYLVHASSVENVHNCADRDKQTYSNESQGKCACALAAWCRDGTVIRLLWSSETWLRKLDIVQAGCVPKWVLNEHDQCNVKTQYKLCTYCIYLLIKSSWNFYSQLFETSLYFVYFCK